MGEEKLQSDNMAAKYVARDAPPRDTWVGSGDPGRSIGIESPLTFDGKKRILCQTPETLRQCITWQAYMDQPK